MRRSNRYAWLAVLVLLVMSSFAQSDSATFSRGRYYKISLSSGGQVNGFVVDENRDWILMESRPDMKRTDVRKSTITKIEELSARDAFSEGTMGGNGFADFYLAGTSALPFEPEQASITAHWLIMDHTQYALNEHWAIHATSLTFYPCALGFRFSYSAGPLDHLGGNVSGFADLPFADGGSELAGYFAQAKWTHGTADRNITFSAGFIGLSAGFFASGPVPGAFLNTPLLSAGFCSRFLPSWCLVLEGHVLPDQGLMLGAGGLKLIRKQTAWTVGCYGLMTETPNRIYGITGRRTIPIPYIGYTWKFE